MIIHGPLSNIAFNNFTTLNDDQLIAELIDVSLQKWDARGMRIVVSVNTTDGDQVNNIDYTLNTVEEISQFNFENIRYYEGLNNFSISVEVFNLTSPDILNSYIAFIFDPTGKVDSIMLGLNELANSYFGSYQYGENTKPFHQFPLIGVCPSPLVGVVNGKMVCSISFPTENRLTTKLTEFGDFIISGNKTEALKQWRKICLGSSFRMIPNSSKVKAFKKSPEDKLDLSISFGVHQVKIVDSLINDYDASCENYKKINNYNDLLLSVFVDGLKAIEENKG